MEKATFFSSFKEGEEFYLGLYSGAIFKLWLQHWSLWEPKIRAQTIFYQSAYYKNAEFRAMARHWRFKPYLRP